jgi:hypothetical protein
MTDVAVQKGTTTPVTHTLPPARPMSEGQINIEHAGRVVQVNNILLLLYVFPNGMPLVPKCGMPGMCDRRLYTKQPLCTHYCASYFQATYRPHLKMAQFEAYPGYLSEWTEKKPNTRTAPLRAEIEGPPKYKKQ